MRLIGILVVLVIIAYMASMQLSSTSGNSATQKPDEYIKQAQQSMDTINKAIQEQQKLIEKAQ